MLLSSSHSQFAEKMPTEAAIDLMADAGFDAIDFSFYMSRAYYDESTDGERGRAYFLDLRARAESRGLVFNQAHAPHGSSFADHAKTVSRFHDIRRSIRNASYLGVKTIIVHPVQHLPYFEAGVPEQFFAWNLEFYAALQPYAEEYGVQIGVENMWQWKNGRPEEGISHSTCSTPAEFVRYLDALDRRFFVGCLDIGHAPLCGVDPCELIRALGRDRLKALHVHDVDGKRDLHTLPYYGGAIDWDAVCLALAEIGYTGDFTFEATEFISPLPCALVPAAAKMMVETGRHLMGKIRA